MCMLWKIRSNYSARCIAFALCVNDGYSWCSGWSLVLVWASTLQNFTVPQSFCAHLSFSMERSRWPCVWRYGIDGHYKSRVSGFPFCLSPFSPFIPSVDHFYMVGFFELIECLHSIPAMHSWLFFDKNYNNVCATSDGSPYNRDTRC